MRNALNYRSTIEYQPARARPDQRPKTIRIVIADRQPIFRQGLRRVIETQSDLRVVGETSDGGEALRLVRKHAPAILLLDLAVSGLAALKVLRDVQSATSQMHGIVLASDIESPDTRQALKFGAHGVIRKDSPPEELLKGIRDVMAGEHSMNGENIPDISGWLRNEAVPSKGTIAHQFHLTPRELQIVSAIAEGETNKTMAKRLGLSGNTIKHHLTSIFGKIGVDNRLELAVFALRVPRSADTSTIVGINSL